MTTHSSILAWGIPMDRGAWWATAHRMTESDMTAVAQHDAHTYIFCSYQKTGNAALCLHHVLIYTPCTHTLYLSAE